MARRSSARLRNRNSSTPKRSSLSRDVLLHTPRTAPVKLQSLREYDEMPGAFPGSVSPPTVDVNKHATKVPLNFNDSTPKQSTPIQPAAEEMSPKHHQQSTAKPMDEARWLGFSNMAPHTEPAKRASKIAVLQATPTKAGNAPASPTFKFTFGREQSLELSPEAKKLMNEKRQEALKIREQMVAEGEGPQDYGDLKARKFATPKGKKSRFSEVHLEQFKKMDSIAGHASAFRADPNRPTATTNSFKSQAEERAIASDAPPKSLKRSPSKAGLTEPERSATLKRADTFDADAPSAVHSKIPLSQKSTDTPTAKRVKRTEIDDVSTIRSAADVNKSLPMTPEHAKKLKEAASMSNIASPTQASLARSASVKSVKSTKIPAPATLVTTPKVMRKDVAVEKKEPSTPLLARTPSKAPIFVKQSAQTQKTGKMLSPLLTRTPSKFSPFKKVAESEDKAEAKSGKAPLLSRSPFKMSRDQLAGPKAEEQASLPRTPLLSRSPKKMTLDEVAPEAAPEQKSASALGGALMGRFNLLRSSPVKSILRSPQRLYSTDPAKVAAGTHLASPATAAGAKDKALPSIPGSGTPAEKHVDFTSSTKARYERAQSELDSTPSQESTPGPKEKCQAKPSPKAVFASYPALPNNDAETSPTPQKRRQTAAPGDFTFTSHGREIIFSQSPNAPATGVAKSLPSTIRHVSAEPQLPSFNAGSKKRKFDFASGEGVEANGVEDNASDKENGGDVEVERPAKRMRSTAPEPAATKTATRLPTLGVKPKKGTKEAKEKKPTVISRARLNALAQPKRKV